MDENEKEKALRGEPPQGVNLIAEPKGDGFTRPSDNVEVKRNDSYVNATAE